LLPLLLQDISTEVVEKSPDFTSDLLARPQQHEGREERLLRHGIGTYSATEGRNETGQAAFHSGARLRAAVLLRSGGPWPAEWPTGKRPTFSPMQNSSAKLRVVTSAAMGFTAKPVPQLYKGEKLSISIYII